MKAKVKIIITLELDLGLSEGKDIVSKVYGAMRGDGDDRLDKNMNADIGWYLKSKIEENIEYKWCEDVKISSHSYQVKEVNDDSNR